MSRGQIFLLAFLMLGVVGSSIAVVNAKYQSRQLFVELQKVHQSRDLLDMEWGRLQLELGAWGTHGRVEKLARDKLHMRLPMASEVIVVTY